MAWGSQRTATTAWRKLRRQILERDGYRCAVVGCTQRANEVDHIRPHSLGGTDDPINLTSICRYHHARKSAAEGHAAQAQRRAAQRRPIEKHPGLL